jgi:MFS family permease
MDVSLGAYVRSLNPRLPRAVQILQGGALLNGFGNGIVYPFLFIYLHNVHGIGAGTVGLILATNGAMALVTGPAAGPLVDRFGGHIVLLGALAFFTLGYGGYALVTHPWQGFLASVIAGIGNGTFWPAQSSLISGLSSREERPAAFAMQRAVMNLGFGLGGVAGGLIASESSPGTFQALFAIDAVTFVAYGLVLAAWVPRPIGSGGDGHEPGSYRDVLRHRVFIRLLALNAVFITAGFAQLELLAVYMKNQAGVAETAIGLVFLVNTLVIVIVQLPVARFVEGRRRMPALAGLGVLWAAAWGLTPVVGALAAGATAAILFALTQVVFATGECLHGAVQNPLVADLARPGLIGRYMALSAWSWQVGFTIGPAVGGFLLGLWPHAVWLAAAGVCAAGGAAALALEPSLPPGVRRSPVRPAPGPAVAVELR